MNKIILLGLIMLLSISCEKKKHFIGSFPETPVNLTDYNTEFDDYNSALPVTYGETFPLCFSSTRNSKGADYDIVYKLMTIEFSADDGTLIIYEDGNAHSSIYETRFRHYNDFVANANLNNALSKINTSYDEFGPYLIPRGMKISFDNMYVFLYSNNSSGNQDIKFTHNLLHSYYEEPREIAFLNSGSDDAYPAMNKDSSEIYFTSNREKDFDIYRASIGRNHDLVDLFTNTTQVPIQKDAALSSESDDKCPFISQDFIVFTSNRPGGYGGYDLYFSRFENGRWNKPENFGNKINTEYDEYKPIVRAEREFKNDFMIFSSNRPGGKGGFDLYYVGIDKISPISVLIK